MKNNITEARRNYEWSIGGKFTQQDAANEFGVSIGTYRNWEQGVNLPKAAVAADMARLYGVSIDYLLGNTDKNSARRNEPVVSDARLEKIVRGWNGLSDEQKDAIAAVFNAMM